LIFQINLAMRVLALVLAPLAASQNQPAVPYDAVPMEVRVPYQVGDCVRAVKNIDYEDLHGSPKIVKKSDKGTLVHVAPDHVVVKWNNQDTLARAAAFPHQVRRAVWPKGVIANIHEWSTDAANPETPKKCMTVVEYHGFAPLIKPMDCVDKWQNQQFTTPLSCRPGPIYWKKDPTLCIDAVHPELVQLRDCNGLDSQMFALASSGKQTTGDVEVTNEGFLVGTGVTGASDLCFKFVDKNNKGSHEAGAGAADALHFGECNPETDTKFQFKDFDNVE